jgi:hypothetical protein
LGGQKCKSKPLYFWSAHEILLPLHCQSEERKDADGECEKFCRPTKKFSQASQIAEQSLTPTLSFREGEMRDNEKYLRWLMADL